MFKVTVRTVVMEEIHVCASVGQSGLQEIERDVLLC